MMRWRPWHGTFPNAAQGFVLLSLPTKSGGDIGMVIVCPCVRASVRPGFRPLSGKVITHFKFGVDIYWVSVQNWFAFGQRRPNFGPLVAKTWLKMGQNGGFRPLSVKYSYNPIQTCGVHLLGECSEMIRFWGLLAQFWPSSGQKGLKVGQTGAFRPLSGKVSTQSNSNIVCTLIGWVFRIGLLFGDVGQTLTL